MTEWQPKGMIERRLGGGMMSAILPWRFQDWLFLIVIFGVLTLAFVQSIIRRK